MTEQRTPWYAGGEGLSEETSHCDSALLGSSAPRRSCLGCYDSQESPGSGTCLPERLIPSLANRYFICCYAVKVRFQIIIKTRFDCNIHTYKLGSMPEYGNYPHMMPSKGE